eukprot:850834-Prorocentrum_minimum.AAC.1
MRCWGAAEFRQVIEWPEGVQRGSGGGPEGFQRGFALTMHTLVRPALDLALAGWSVSRALRMHKAAMREWQK